MEMITVILVVVVLLAIAVFGLAIQIIFSKSHKFPDTHVGHNKNMKGLGITCATTMDKIEQRKGMRPIETKPLHLSNH